MSNSLASEIISVIHNNIEHINTFDIARVDSLNETNNTLNITLMRIFESRFNDYSESTIPQISFRDVPVMRPGCRNFSIVPRYSEGDLVIVGYMKKDPYQQLTAEEPQNLEFFKSFNSNNAVVLGTIPKWSYIPPTALDEDDSTVTIKHKNGTTIVFDTEGGCSVVTPLPVRPSPSPESEEPPKTYSKINMDGEGNFALSVVNNEEEKNHLDLKQDGSASLVVNGKYGIDISSSGAMTIKASSVNFVKTE